MTTYGLCPAGHALARYDDPKSCPACRSATSDAGLGMGLVEEEESITAPRPSHGTLVPCLLCDPGHPSAECPECGGSGDVVAED